ncbi:MAG: cache domain-containing protein [Cyanobacteria bacterium J06639_1]
MRLAAKDETIPLPESSRPAPRSTSLRAILLVPFVVQMALTSAAIAWLGFSNSERAVNDIATRLRVEISARIIERLERYLTTPVPILELNAGDVRDGRLDVQNLSSLEAHLFEESLVFDSVDQVYFGRADGEFVGVATLHDGNRDLDVTEGTGNLNSYLLDAAGNRVSLSRSTPYDPRERPWYEAAIEAEGLVWSPIYAWASVDTYGITLSKPQFDAAGNILGVLGVDLSLVTINDFLRGLNVSHSGKVFILERSGDLVASSTSQIPFREVGDRIDRIDIVDIRDPLIRNTVNFLNREYENLDRIQTPQSLSFEFQDDTQFVQVTPWQDAYGLDWIVAIVVPSSDFLIQIERNTQATLLLCLGTILVSLVAGVYLSRRISAPILKLNQAVKDIAKGNWSQMSTTSRIAEVRELSQSFNRMSASLQDSFTQLEQVLAERTDDLDVSQQRYRRLFDDAPNPLWEVDFSVVYFYLKELQQTQHVKDFAQYFSDHPEAIAICADLVRVLDVNQSAERFLDTRQKQTAMDMLPRTYRAEASHLFQAELLSLLAGNVHFESEFSTQTVSGESKDAILKHFIAPTYEVTWKRLVIAVVDISDRRQAELQLEQRSEELARALEDLKMTQADLVASAKQAALANSVAGVAHEINTPIGTAITISSTLENESNAIATKLENSALKRSDLHHYVDTAAECSHLILSNLNRAGSLVRSFKQIAVDRTHDVVRTFAVKPYLVDVVMSLSHDIKRAGHHMSVRGDEAISIASYPGALSQTIANLVMNSIAHAYPNGDAGTFALAVERSPNGITLTYTDDGCGIAETHLDRIFEPFFTTAPHAGGSGLGLHITYNLVTETLQGAIAVRSQVGVGTSFVISLPARVSQAKG